MCNYFVKVSDFPVKEQRKLRSVGGERWGWGSGGEKDRESRSLHFLFLLLPFLKGVLPSMLWMAFSNQENIRALILTIAKIRFPPNSQNMFLF